uniref:PHD finger protein rhinoceros n=1 Tax=Anopheles minimus TaxID=112268 RepID=A0A182WI61_9DIPT
MSQKSQKRTNRGENDGPPPIKKRKGRPPVSSSGLEDEKDSPASNGGPASSSVGSSGGGSGGGPTTPTKNWQPRSVIDCKMSSIYNRTAPEAPAELFRKDLISAMKLPDSEPLAADEYWVIADQWKQEWERGVQVPVNPDSLPEPSVATLQESYFKKRHDFKLPKNKYIRITKDENFTHDQHYLSNTPAIAENVCYYDLDQFDAAWLKVLNGERNLAGLVPVTDEQFERVVEELEGRCLDKIQAIMKTEEGLGIEYDENVICDVCRSPDSEEANEMVFCDNCNICVHQACYGITNIPSGQWLCRTCSMGQKPKCVLCPNMGGAMKSTRSGQKWAHVSCALWIPEVSIGSVDRMEPITKISNIPSSRWALVCALCRERVGACIQCSVKTCKTAYHVTCAFQHGLEMRAIIEDENAEDGVKLRSYCQKHGENKGKRDNSRNNTKNNAGGASGTAAASGGSDEETGNTGPGTNTVASTAGGDMKRRKRKDMTSEERNLARAARQQEIEAEFDKHVSVKDISCHLLDVDQEGIYHIYNYWILKRKAGHNRPLLPPKTDEVDPNAQNQEQAEIEKMKTFVHLRQDLERVRNLCYMVSRREKLSRSFFRMREQTFNKQVAALTAFRNGGVGEATNHQRNSGGSAALSQIDPAMLDAILHANHGPTIYDRLYSCNSVSSTMPSLDEMVERIISGVNSSNSGISSGSKDAASASGKKPTRSKNQLTAKRQQPPYINGTAGRRSTSISSASEMENEDEDTLGAVDKTNTKKKPRQTKVVERKRRKAATSSIGSVGAITSSAEKSSIRTIDDSSSDDEMPESRLRPAGSSERTAGSKVARSGAVDKLSAAVSGSGRTTAASGQQKKDFRNQSLRQMERELADDRRAMHLIDDDDSNDSDELMHIRPGSGGTVGRAGSATGASNAIGGNGTNARGKKIPDIYSDSDSTDRDKTDHTASDSQQHPFRTKAAMKEFNLQQEADRLKQKSPTKAGRSSGNGAASASSVTLPGVTAMALPVATPTSALPGAKVSSTKLATSAQNAGSIQPDVHQTSSSKRLGTSAAEQSLLAPSGKAVGSNRSGSSSTKEGHTASTKKKQAQQVADKHADASNVNTTSTTSNSSKSTVSTNNSSTTTSGASSRKMEFLADFMVVPQREAAKKAAENLMKTSSGTVGTAMVSSGSAGLSTSTSIAGQKSSTASNNSSAVVGSNRNRKETESKIPATSASSGKTTKRSTAANVTNSKSNKQKDSVDSVSSKVDAKLSTAARNKSKERPTVADKQPPSGTTGSAIRSTSNKEQQRAKDRLNDDSSPVTVPLDKTLAEKAKLSKEVKQKRETQPEIFAYVPQRQAAKKAAEHIKSGLGKPSGADQTAIVATDEKAPMVATPVPPSKASAGSKMANKGRDERKSNATAGSSSSNSSSSSGGSSSSSCSSSSSSGSESEEEEEEDETEETNTLGKKSATVSGGNRAKASSNSAAPTAKAKQQQAQQRTARQDVLPFLDKGPARSVSESSSSSSSSSSSGSSSDSDSDSSSSNQSSQDEANETSVVPAPAASAIAASGRNRRKSVSAASVKQQDSASPKKPLVPQGANNSRKGPSVGGRKPSITAASNSDEVDAEDTNKEQHSTSKPTSANSGKGKEATARGGKEKQQLPVVKSNDDESSVPAGNVPGDAGAEKPIGSRRNSYQPPTVNETPLKRGGRRQSVFVGVSDIEEKQRKLSLVPPDVPTSRNTGRRKTSEAIESDKDKESRIETKKPIGTEASAGATENETALEDAGTPKRPIVKEQQSPVARKRRSPNVTAEPDISTSPSITRSSEAKELESETKIKSSQTPVNDKNLEASGSDEISLLTDEDSADHRKAKEKLHTATTKDGSQTTSSVDSVVAKNEDAKVGQTKNVEIISLVDDSRSNDDVVVIEDGGTEAKVVQKPQQTASAKEQRLEIDVKDVSTQDLLDEKPFIDRFAVLKDSLPLADVKDDVLSKTTVNVDQSSPVPTAIVQQASFDSTAALQINKNSTTPFAGEAPCDDSAFATSNQAGGNSNAGKDDSTGTGSAGLISNSDGGTPSIFDLLLPQDSSVTDDTFELNQSLNFPFMEDCKEDTQRETLNLVEKLRQKYKKPHGTANTNASNMATNMSGSEPLKSMNDVSVTGDTKENDMLMLEGVVTAQVPPPSTQSPLLVTDFVTERPKQDGTGHPLGSTLADSLLGGKDKLQPELEYGAFNKFHSATATGTLRKPLDQLPTPMPGSMQPAVQQATQQQPQTNQLQAIGQQSQTQIGNKSAKEDHLDHLASRPSDERWVPPSSVPSTVSAAPSMLHHTPLPTSVGSMAAAAATSSVLGGNTVSTAQLAQNCMEAARLLNSHQTNNNNNVNALDSEKTHGTAGPATGGGLFDGATSLMLFENMQQRQHPSPQQPVGRRAWNQSNDGLSSIDQQQKKQHECAVMQEKENLLLQKQQQQQQLANNSHRKLNDLNSFMDIQNTPSMVNQQQPSGGQSINNSNTGASNSVNAMQQQQPYGFSSTDAHPAHHQQQQQQQQQHYPGAVSLFPPASVPVPFPSPGAGLYPPNFGNAGYQQPTPPQTTVPNAGKPHQHQHHAPGAGLGTGVPPMPHHGMGLGDAMVSPHRSQAAGAQQHQQQKQLDQMSSPLSGMAASPNKQQQQSRQPTPTEQQNSYLLNSGGNGGTSSGGSTPRTPQHRRTPQRHNHQMQGHQPDVVGMDMLVGVGHSTSKKSPTKSSRSSSRIQNQQQQQQQQPPPHLQQHHAGHHHHHPLLMNDSNGASALAGMVHPMGHQLKSPPSLTAGTKSLSPGKSPKTGAAAVYEMQKAISGNTLVPPLSSSGSGKGPKGGEITTGKPGRGRGRGRGRPPGSGRAAQAAREAAAAAALASSIGPSSGSGGIGGRGGANSRQHQTHGSNYHLGQLGPGSDFGCFGSGTIHSKIIGTVYDLDFDEVMVCGKLRDMRDRRRSTDGRSADASGANVGSGGAGQGGAGGTTGGPDSKSSRGTSSSGTASGTGPATGGSTNSGYGSTASSVAASSLPDMAVLPGPVDMRTYNSGFDSSSNTDAYNNQLLGVFASGTADQTLADIDEDMENELQSALKADSVSNRSAAAAAASLAQTTVQTNTSTGSSSLLAAVTATANCNSNSSSSTTSESNAANQTQKTGSMATGAPFVPSITPPCATTALPATMLNEDPMLEQPQEETNDSDSLLPIVSNPQQQYKMSSLADSRNIMKLKIKGPLAQLDSSGAYGGAAGGAGSSASSAVVSQLQQTIGMASSMGVQMGGSGSVVGIGAGGVGGVGGVGANVVGGAAGSSNLRRMRKKELLRQYWNQDMNQDDPQAVLQSADHHHLHHHHHHHAQGMALGGAGRTTVGFPKAVESLGTMPTKDDYKEYGGIHRKKLSSNMSRELRQLSSVPQAADHHELMLAERRRSVGGSIGAVVGGASGGVGANGSAMNLSMDDVSGVGMGGVGIGVAGAGGVGGGAGGKRRSRNNRSNANATATVTAVSQQTPQQAPKLKIKLGSGIVDGGPYGMTSMNAGPSTSSSLRPPKKRLACSVPPPSLEDLKREYMMYAENISFEDDGPGGAADAGADSGDEEPKAKKHKHKDKDRDRDRSGSEHKKRKKEKKHKRDKGEKNKVEIICNAAVTVGGDEQTQQQPPRIVIRLGVKKPVQSEESHAPSPQSQPGNAASGGALASPQKTPVNEDRTATRSSGCSSSPETDPLVIDLAAIHNTNSQGQSLQPSPEMDHRTAAAQAAPAEKPLITPIRLKLARSSAGGGYVMSSKQSAAQGVTDSAEKSNPAPGHTLTTTSPSAMDASADKSTMQQSAEWRAASNAAAGSMDLSTSAAEVAAATSSKNMIERLLTAANLTGSSPNAFERAMGAAAVVAAAAAASSNGGVSAQQQQSSQSGGAFASMYGMSSMGTTSSSTTTSNTSMSFKNLLDFAASTNTTFSTSSAAGLFGSTATHHHHQQQQQQQVSLSLNQSSMLPLGM